MLTCLKTSSLACKCVDQNIMQSGDSMELNFERHEEQK